MKMQTKKRGKHKLETRFLPVPTITKNGRLAPLPMPLGTLQNDEKIEDSEEEENSVIDLGLYYQTDFEVK